MKSVFFIFNFLAICRLLSADDGYPRKLNMDVIHYEFNLIIQDSTDKIEGKAIIRVKFSERSGSASFDLAGADSKGKGMTVKNVSVKGKTVSWEHKGKDLLISFSPETEVSDTIDFLIEYNGIPSDGLIISRNRYESRTFFSDHWPDRAHNYLPCIDHPYDKSAVDFIITAPDQYRIIANGNLIEESDLPGKMTLTHWREKIPLPVKVMAFGGAAFAVKSEGSVNNVPVWTWVFPENREKGFNDYSIAGKPLKYYSEIIGDYPYTKLANVQSKTIFGGLENAGTIFYAERSVNGRGNAERLIAHELAHQWFGNSVTENDWHHVWLSEGFATYFTSMYFESYKGKESMESDMISDRERIIEFHRGHKAPVIDTTVSNMMELLNTNSYQKGAWVLHMLRKEIGDEAFIKGIRLWYTRFLNSNAGTTEFKNIMEEVSGQDLGVFFQQWLYKSGHPQLSITQNKTGKEVELIIEQKQENLFQFDLELLIKYPDGQKITNIRVDKRSAAIRIPFKGKFEVIPDPEVKLLFEKF